MGLDRTTSATIIDELPLPERLAIWTFRCVEQAPRNCMERDFRLVRDLQPAIAALQAFQAQATAQRQAGLRLAPWGSRYMTRDERRLLRVAAALQSGTTELADNFLFRFAPSQSLRRHLTQAMTTLAAILGAEGYWLHEPSASRPFGPRKFERDAFPITSAFAIA